MKKKYRKPVVLKREQNRAVTGPCGEYYTIGCGQLVWSVN